MDLAAQDSKIGEIVNLMSSDIDNILNAVAYVHWVWVPFLQLVASATLLNLFIGAAFWGAVVFMVAIVPVYVVIFSFLSKYQKALQKRKVSFSVISMLLPIHRRTSLVRRVIGTHTHSFIHGMNQPMNEPTDDSMNE